MGPKYLNSYQKVTNIYQYHPISYFSITIFQAIPATRKSWGPTIARILAIATSLKHVLSALYDIHICRVYILMRSPYSISNTLW